MEKAQALESIIVADCGRRLTRALLVETVEGVCRFVAQGTSPSTLEPPYDDLGAGLRSAIEALERATARRFQDRARLIMPQEDTGDGVDAVLTTVAVAPPLRIALLADSAAPLVPALLAASRQLPVIVLPPWVSDGPDRHDRSGADGLVALGQSQPDLLLIAVQAPDERVLRHLLGLGSEVVAAASIPQAPPPAIIVIADERFRAQATAVFSHDHEFGFLPCPPAISSADADGLSTTIAAELVGLADRRARRAVPGLDAIAKMSLGPPLGRTRSLELVNHFMALQFDCPVITVDLDDGLLCCQARGETYRVVTEPLLDLALGAANLLTALDPAAVLRWLPFSYDVSALQTWILNRAVRPFTLPIAWQDHLIEAALVRELLRRACTELSGAPGSSCDPALIVAGSFFARWPDPLMTFLTLVEGLRPRSPNGLVQVAIDRDGVLPAVGALGVIEPDHAAELFEHDGLSDLGAYLAIDCPVGEVIEGQLEYGDGRSRAFTITAGTLMRLPLAEGERADALCFAPGGQARIGAATPGAGARLADDAAPRGGSVGLVIDARGQASDPPGDERARIERLQAWSAALGR